MHKVTVGGWRTGERGPMRVVSGAIGKEKVHYEAPEASLTAAEMNRFLDWFNASQKTDPS